MGLGYNFYRYTLYQVFFGDLYGLKVKLGPIGGDIQMNTVQEIEKAITQLPKDDLAALREWFEEFEAKIWDNQFEEDVQSGKLEKLANKAITDFRAGKCKEL